MRRLTETKSAVASMPNVHPQAMAKTEADDWMSHDANGRLILDVKGNTHPAGDNSTCSFPSFSVPVDTKLWWFGMKQQIYQPEKVDTNAMSPFCYCGGWWKDQENGKGTLSYVNGCTFVGNFERGGRVDGEGSMAYNNGDKYTGAWVDSKRSGHGVIDYAGGSRYVGKWDNDRKTEGKVDYQDASQQ
jgi:hypothetical protein